MLADKRAILQCLGCLMKSPTLFDEYRIESNDFSVESFYEIIFSSIYNLYIQGAKVIDTFTIDSFLANYEKQHQIFDENKGIEYCDSAIELAEIENFPYYYERLRKFSLLRFVKDRGLDSRILYDDTITDPALQEVEMSRLDNMSINELIDCLEYTFVVETKNRFGTDGRNRGQLAGENMKNLKEELKQAPEYGLPLQSPIMTTIARGARKGKIYLRSSSSGGGKTRTALADLCNISIPWYYDSKKKEWVHTGFSEPSLFISTELQADEIQTIIMAYVSDVPEEHILDGNYQEGEEERVDRAIEHIISSPFYIEFIPDFGIQDIVNVIKTYRREKCCSYYVFDYIHMSARLIAEVTQMSNGIKMREDQVLFLFIDALKNLCVNYEIFILTMTQLNGTYKDSAIKDETMLRGAKNLADRIDLGEISLPPTNQELESVKKIMKNMVNVPEPTLIRHIYKVRRGKLTRIRVWQKADLSTGRTIDLFVTDNNYKLIPVEATKIEKIDEIINKNSIDNDSIVVSEEETAEATKALFDW